MDSALLHSLQFAFTVTYYYLFSQLIMGLAPLIVILKTLAIRKNDETYNQAMPGCKTPSDTRRSRMGRFNSQAFGHWYLTRGPGCNMHTI
jgi:hypothetical protein